MKFGHGLDIPRNQKHPKDDVPFTLLANHLSQQNDTTTYHQMATGQLP
jgi:hypothetical protein